MESLSEHENMDVPKTEIDEGKKPETLFKKPVLVGKIGKLPKKLLSTASESSHTTEKGSFDLEKSQEVLKPDQNIVSNSLKGPIPGPAPQPTSNSIMLPYEEPPWSGLPESNGKDYVFEVLKNGVIIDTINLMDKSFWTFGRLANCDVCMQHPTISRYHAVLQYRQEASESDEPGFYIYDLDSTHGTFLNKSRLKPKEFVRMQVGHMLKLGCSSRSYILSGPEYDTEEESELSVTELKQKREIELFKRQEEKLRIEKELQEKKRKEEERGVDWGLGEDAEEETDLSENPYAQTNNEELYLDDPKKALRGFFEREGLNLEYDCNEQGIGQFLCKVELPLDDELGRPIVAEVLHKGKKKEAVIQCALEACRILDRYGVLRQATHESRKRKAKNWEENDFYDSDEDTFLDRTGTIEKKREKRMSAKTPQKAETYESLVEKENIISKKILELQTQLDSFQGKNSASNNENNDEDSLDSYMKGLSDKKVDKNAISNIKMELAQHRAEQAKVVRLINIVKPANMPALVPTPESSPSTSKDSKAKSLPIFGKRKKIQVKFKEQSKVAAASNIDLDAEIEEEEHEEEDERTSADEIKEDKINKEENKTEEALEGNKIENNPNNATNPDIPEESLPGTSQDSLENYSSSSSSSVVSDEEIMAGSNFTSIKSLRNMMTFKKFESILKKGLPSYAGKHQEKLEKILNSLKKLAANEDRMHVDWKILSAKKKKVMKLISDMKHSEPDEKLEHRVSSDLSRILLELNSMTEQKYKVLDKVKKMGNEIQNISEAMEQDFQEYKRDVAENRTRKLESKEYVRQKLATTPPERVDTPKSRVAHEEAASSSNVPDRLSDKEDCSEGESALDEKKKKKNQKRNQQRQEKVEQERQKGYEEDASRENYSMWLPPSDQSGDGRISLNEKYGY